MATSLQEGSSLRDTATDGSQLQGNGIVEEKESPQSSPKRKSLGSFRGGGKSEAPRRKTERKNWKSRLASSFRRKTKRRVESHGDNLESTDFSFRYPVRALRGSPSIMSSKTRDSPSLDLHKLRKPTHSSLEVSRRQHHA